MWGQGLDTIPQSTLLSSLSNQQAKQFLKGQRACGVTCEEISLSFPSNFEMCEEILDGIGSHVA
jgi:hypothetical protein